MRYVLIWYAAVNWSYLVELLVKSQTTDVPQRHKSKKSEMFGPNVADKYASTVTKNFSLGCKGQKKSK